MKRKLSFLLLLLLSGLICRAQTSSDYITQGRSYLAVSNIVSASISFSNAVALAPTDPTANVFYGITRLLALPSQTAVSNFLTTLGVPAAGRNIYQWKAQLPHDTNGFPIAPAGVSITNATSLARRSVLNEIIGAEANLAAVTDTNFTLALTAQDTSITAVTMDYGDIQLIRSALDGFEYFIYNTYDWNLDVQLSVLRSLYSSNGFALDTLLTDYPSLFAFATTNDLLSAKTAFVKGENTYVVASSIIRNRPTGTMRLFNFAPDEAQRETLVRETLFDLANSLTNGPVVLEANSNYSIFLSPTFTGEHSLRSFFPRIASSGFVLGSFPDPTLGGVISGLSSSNFDNALAKHLTPIPDIVPGTRSEVQFAVHSMAGHGYIVQASADLILWTNVTAFVAFSNTYAFSDPAGHSDVRHFYRVVDAHNNLPPPVNDDFANASVIPSLGIWETGYDNNATYEAGEPPLPTVWWNWTAPVSEVVVATTFGSPSYVFPAVFVGDSTTNLTLPETTTLNGGFDDVYQGFPFFAVAGTVYHIQVSEFSFDPQSGAIQVAVATQPTMNISSPIDGSSVPVSTGLTLSANASDAYGPISQIEYTIIGNGPNFGVYIFQTVKGPSLSTTLTNLPPSNYEVNLTAFNSFGIPISQTVYVTLTP